MELVVRHSGRPCCRMWVEEGRAATAWQLKVRLRSLLGVPCEYQRLMCGGAEAWDDTRPLNLSFSRPSSSGPDGEDAGSEAAFLDLVVHRQARLPNFLARHGFSNLASRDSAGRTPFHLAAELGDREVCAEILLEASNADVNAVDGSGETVLHFAARHRRGDIGMALLIADFDQVNARNDAGATALHLAAAYGSKNLCKALLDCSRFHEANARDDHGRTALHNAAANGHAEVCRLLLEHAAFTERAAEDTTGLSALDVARPRAFQVLLACRDCRPVTEEEDEVASGSVKPV